MAGAHSQTAVAFLHGPLLGSAHPPPARGPCLLVSRVPADTCGAARRARGHPDNPSLLFKMRPCWDPLNPAALPAELQRAFCSRHRPLSRIYDNRARGWGTEFEWRGCFGGGRLEQTEEQKRLVSRNLAAGWLAVSAEHSADLLCE
ncbi:hypothetical protein NDU88_003117 [Pleurodeles waltl]|uniref:Uncharacterized protein n=1 Tax=Pleurodeles waltl TaxID=8319 RepID=A0AAV7UZ88_PLEWA|nr:hypothetical protein NDU88_003117 [Pleurodeles waltl]